MIRSAIRLDRNNSKHITPAQHNATMPEKPSSRLLGVSHSKGVRLIGGNYHGTQVSENWAIEWSSVGYRIRNQMCTPSSQQIYSYLYFPPRIRALPVLRLRFVYAQADVFSFRHIVTHAAVQYRYLD